MITPTLPVAVTKTLPLGYGATIAERQLTRIERSVRLIDALMRLSCAWRKGCGAIRQPAAMGRGAAPAFAMGFPGRPAQDQEAAGLRGADRVTIWRDGTVADGRGEVIGNLYDEG